MRRGEKRIGSALACCARLPSETGSSPAAGEHEAQASRAPNEHPAVLGYVMRCVGAERVANLAATLLKTYQLPHHVAHRHIAGLLSGYLEGTRWSKASFADDLHEVVVGERA